MTSIGMESSTTMPQARKGVVYIFKPVAQPDTMTIRLRGVQADAPIPCDFRRRIQSPRG